MLWGRSHWSILHVAASRVACWDEPAPVKSPAGEWFENGFQLRKSVVVRSHGLEGEKLFLEMNNDDLEERERKGK